MTRWFLRHPVSTWMLFTAFVVLGAYSLPRLKLEAVPEVDLPTLTVSTAWPGASPEAIHRSITLPVEEAAGRVHGVEKVKSTSQAGNSQVEVSFRREIDVDFARVELNEQLGTVRRLLPQNAGQPVIVPYVPEEFRADQFFTMSLESDLPPNDLREAAETWIVPRLLAVDGVADAVVQGGARPLLKILLDRRKLELYGITADEVFRAVDALDALEGAGAVRQAGAERLLALREPVDRDAIAAAVVARRGERVFRLDMLGEVQSTHEDPDYFVRADGRNVVQIRVEKRSGANTVAVSGALRDALPAIRAVLPFDVAFHVDVDRGDELRDKLVELVYRSLAILGILFVLLVLSLRQVRLTAIVMGSILFATVISLSMFYFLKISVNFITISGLTVCFGMLLDNSILVLDAIHRRLVSLERADRAGLSRRARLRVATEMIASGSREVVFPVMATTATTVVAFLSFIFLSGRLALFYVPLAISVATAMGASIFVAFGWIPVALNQGWAAPLVRRAPDGPNEVEDGETIHRFVEDLPDLDSPPGFLDRAFMWVQRLWWVILPATGGLVVWTFLVVYPDKVIKGGFWRMPDEEELFLYLEMPAGTDVEVTAGTLNRFEASLLPVPDGARLTSTTFGNRAVLRVEFEDDLLESEYPLMYREYLVQTADQTGGASVFIRGFSDRPYFKGPFTGSSLNSLVKITGYNSRRLNGLADGALERLERQRRVRNARITSGQQFDRAFNEETVLTVDRERLVEHDLSVLEVVGTLRRLLGVDSPWTMMIEGKRQRMQLAYADARTIEYSDVADKVILNSRGERVRLGDVVALETRPVRGSIVRENQRYTMFLNWEYVGTDKMRRNFIQRTLDEIRLPYGYAAEEATQEFFTEEEEEQLTLALILAIAFIFMVLAALFESISLPFIVLLSLPLAMIGVFLAFWIAGSTFDSSARIGLILLFGVAVNNAILLVSRFRTEAVLILRARLGGDPEGESGLFATERKSLGGTDLRRLDRAERVHLLLRAVARATHTRMRSILLTSGTTIIGLLPLLVQFKDREGQDIWENLALSSIGGLVSSTVLLIVALPPLYYVTIRVSWWWWALVDRVRARFTRGRTTPQEAEAV